MNIIKNLRDNFRLLQADIAAYLGVDRSYVSMMENDVREIPSLICDQLLKLEESLMSLNYIPPAKKRNRKKPGPDLEIKLARLQKKLFRMIELYTELCAELQKYETLRKLPHDELRGYWYEMKISDVKYKLKSCNEEKQQKLQQQIDKCRREMEGG